MKTLVTGATGFLGSALVRRLVREDVRVRALHRAGSRRDMLADVSHLIEWVEGDLGSGDSLEKALDGVDTLYHVAAFVGIAGPRDRARLMEVNVRGTARVVDAALRRGVRRMVHTSSISALGETNGQRECLDETAEWHPSSTATVYGESKYRAELEVQRGIAEGLDATIVNPSLIMGECRADENTGLLVAKVRNESLPFLPSGSTNVVDVLDVVDGHLRAMESGRTGERYILAGENLSWEEIIRRLAEAFHVRPPRRPVPMSVALPIATVLEFAGRLAGRRPLVTRETVRRSASRHCYNNEKAVTELGCSFRPFQETVDRLAATS